MWKRMNAAGLATHARLSSTICKEKGGKKDGGRALLKLEHTYLKEAYA